MCVLYCEVKLCMNFYMYFNIIVDKEFTPVHFVFVDVSACMVQGVQLQM